MTEEQSYQSHSYEIDRGSPEPAYSQLANILRRQIAEGRLRPGDQLPSEAQLCRQYGISPMTVRRTINLLADQDVVSTAQGRGTFVKPLELGGATFDLHELQDFFGGRNGTQVKLLDARIVTADERTARKLGRRIGDPVIYIRRLLSRGSAPNLYHREYLVYDPTLPVVEAEMDATSLQGLFSGGQNTMLKYGELTIEATLMNEEEARVLHTTLPCAAFYLEHVFYDFHDRPISWGWFVFRSNHMRFNTTVGVDLSSSSDESR